MNKFLREPINGLTHLIGALLSFIGLIALVIKTSINEPTAIALFSVIIFGVSMILLYSASATYHMVISTDRVIQFLRKLDHSMIFLLIAGSYAPFCLITLGNKLGWTLFAIIIGSAIIGICFKMIWFNCPRILSTLMYLIMGWLSIILVPQLNEFLSFVGFNLLLLGGIFYSIGGIIYAIKPKFLEFKHFGHHEVFHIFVMLGTLMHYICIFEYVI